MQNFGRFCFFIAGSVLLSVSSRPLLGQNDEEALKLVDYNRFTHELSLTSFRAGNHDEDGRSEYVIKVVVVALVAPSRGEKKEQVLGSESGKKSSKEDTTEQVRVEVASSPMLQLPALSFWQPDEKQLKAFKLKVEGDHLRRVVAQAMQRHQVKESAIRLQVKVILEEHSKRYLVLDDNRVIKETMYDPLGVIEDAPKHIPKGDFRIRDDFGLLATLSVAYPMQMTPADPKGS